MRIAANFRYMFGGIDGFIQVPSGGEPGTTSPNRPTVSELGIDAVNVFDASLDVQVGAHTFFGGAQIVRLNGSATLDRDLLTQNTLFPAGVREHADVQLDWYRFGYEYAFTFDLNDEGLKLRLAPGIEGVLFDFDYRIDASGGLRAHRSYAKGGVGVGGAIELLTGGPFTVEADGFWGLPIDNFAAISSVEVVGKYQLWGTESGWAAAVFLGVGYERIEYQDNQTVPNHTSVDLGPLLVAGFQIRF